MTGAPGCRLRCVPGCDALITGGERTRVTFGCDHLHRFRRAEQTMGMPALRYHWSATQVRALIEESPTAGPRYELMGGELIATPAPGGIHQVAVAQILVLLRGYLAREPVGVALTSPADLQLHPDSITQPDVCVVPLSRAAEPGHAFTWADIATLLLAVEVLSPGSIRTDRVEKRDYYLSARGADYWVVDVDERVIECWTPQRATPLVDRHALEWRPPRTRATLTISLTELFEQIWSEYRSIGGYGS